MLHDAVELFAHLAAEVRNPPNLGRNFMDYWKAMADLPYARQMERLNKARVALKHHGVLPAHVEIDGLKAVVAEFLDEACRIIFGLDLNSVSMIDLVEPEEARSCLGEG